MHVIFTDQGLSTSRKPPSETGADPDGVWLGEQIRNLRRQKGVSLDRLQQATGRSIGFLSQLERGKSRANVQDLTRIATALAIPFHLLFYTALEAERGAVMRQENRPRLRYRNGISDYLLSPNLGGQVEMLLTEFQPGASSGDDDFVDEGHETGMVVTGEMALWLDSRRFHLKVGDSFSYDATKPHRYANAVDQITEVVWVVARFG